MGEEASASIWCDHFRGNVMTEQGFRNLWSSGGTSSSSSRERSPPGMVGSQGLTSQ